MDRDFVPRRAVKRPRVTRIVAPAFGAVAVMAALVAALIVLAAHQANSLAAVRQQKMVATVLAQSMERMGHDQEAMTVWDDAIRKVRALDYDLPWLDLNLGSWFFTHYGHAESFVVDPTGRPVYAMRRGRPVVAEVYYDDLAPSAAPLIAALRRRLRQPAATNIDPLDLSPGIAGFGMAGAHPAIISVKPIVTDTGRLKQAPGTEYLHITVRDLDGRYMAELAGQYQLDEARFATAIGRGRSGVPLRSANGELLGYLTWKPFQPGSVMLQRISPVMGCALLLMLVIVGLLLLRVRRGTLQLEASEGQAKHVAVHDPLTGLANRARFEQVLAHELAQVRGGRGSLALLYLDLDGFKEVNDTFGHPAGDELIRGVAARLVDNVRATDLVARMGGDEFIVLQCDIGSPAAAEILCMRLIEAICVPFEIGGSQMRVGVSIGIAMGPIDADEPTELARKADIALYEAKAAGRGRFMFFAESMDASIRRRREIEGGLRSALADGGQLAVHYQPIYSAPAGQLRGAEALVRWHHPERGLIAPGAFVPIAEESGLIGKLGEWVLDEACRTAVRWPAGTLAVNVSAVQLRQAGFAARALAIVDAAGLDPSRLEVEITETSLIQNTANCQPNLLALRARGVKIALDDFGTGYSSFSHLRGLTVDRIKIDRSFVNGIDSSEGGRPIIHAIVALAKASGLKVTAEGVETSEQSRFLADAGCDALQGFYLARPMPADGLDALFARQQANNGEPWSAACA